MTYPEYIRRMRTAYCKEVQHLRFIADELRQEGRTNQEIAIRLHQLRREIGIKYKDMTPEPTREQIYSRNRKKYGDKLGPTITYLHDYQGKTWEQIIASAITPNPGDIDQLLE